MKQLLVISLLSTLFLFNLAGAGETVKPKKWEYKIWTHSPRVNANAETPQKKLSELGMDGWELVSVVSVVHGPGTSVTQLRHYFKREVRSKCRVRIVPRVRNVPRKKSEPAETAEGVAEPNGK